MASNRVLYGVPIHQAKESGDLEQMRKVAAEAEQHLKEHGDVAGALKELKAEIARVEGGDAA